MKSKKQSKVVANISTTNVSSVIKSGFSIYSKHIILERALPNVLDGLKPVQRRIIYALFKLGLTHDKNFKKSARTVGEVIAKYHPHGDSSVYEALIRLSQWWKMNLELVTIQGNNGSIDNDPPAAMRYTEAKLSSVSTLFLSYIRFSKCTKYIANFDDSEREPFIFPTLFPNILINGVCGIASGFATNILPHNPLEVINAIIYRIKKPNCELSQILKIIQGPDFPTKGIIEFKDSCADIYSTGKGRIINKSSYKVSNNKKSIIVTSIPYGVNKSVIIQKLNEIRLNNKEFLIKSIIDQSSNDIIEIHIQFSKSLNNKQVEYVVYYLYKNTKLMVSNSMNMVCIIDEHPELCPILNIIDAIRKNAKVVLRNMYLSKIEILFNRQNVLEGLIKIHKDLKTATNIIISSKNKEKAMLLLSNEFGITNEQSTIILKMKLQQLTKHDVTKYKKEYNAIKKELVVMKSILNNKSKLDNCIITEYKNMLILFKDKKRKSKINNKAFKLSVFQKKEEKNNYIKIFDKSDYCLAYDSKGILYKTENFNLFDEKILKRLKRHKIEKIQNNYLKLNNLKKIIIILSSGHYIKTNLYSIEKNFSHINDYFSLDLFTNKIIKIFSYTKESEDLVIITKKGNIKKMKSSVFNRNQNNKKSKFIKLISNDQITNIFIIKNENSSLLLVTSTSVLISTTSVSNIPSISWIKTLKSKTTTYIKSVLLVEDISKLIIYGYLAKTNIWKNIVLTKSFKNDQLFLVTRYDKKIKFLAINKKHLLYCLYTKNNFFIFNNENIKDFIEVNRQKRYNSVFF